MDEIGAALALATVCIPIFLSSQKVSTDEFVAASLQAGIITEHDQGGARAFANAILNNRNALEQNRDQKKLATALLPALTQFQTVVDLRPSFSDEEEIEFMVPVSSRTLQLTRGISVFGCS